MALSKRDREFRLPRISYLEFKQTEMDRVLTGFFARLAHNGYPSRLKRNIELTLPSFLAEFLEHPEWFRGFAEHPEILERWLETHLMDMVNRGEENKAIAAPRPLHGYTYRFRNSKHSRDYGAAQHLYEMLHGARAGSGQKALGHLKDFFFQGQDKVTGQTESSATLDVETQALLRLSDQVEDAPDTHNGRESYPPLCIGAADLLAEDVMRLLFYQPFIPRSVMVEYLKILLSFHLALYHLRLFKLLPALVRRKGGDPTCDDCPMKPKSPDAPHGDCPYTFGIVVDVAGRPGTEMAVLAEHSADVHYRRIPAFIRAYFSVKKLDEFAQHLVKRLKLDKPAQGSFSVGELLTLLEPAHTEEREKFFGARISQLMQDLQESNDAALDPEIAAVNGMKLTDFEAYIEMLVAARGPFHRQYITETLDSLLLKNRQGALVAQPRIKNGARRFVLDSRTLEVLLQLAVLKPGGFMGYHTAEIRIDELLLFLRTRYGLYVDQLPVGDGFGPANLMERNALRANLAAFTSRLRDIGFYRDLSDAYLTQTVVPRYRIGFHNEPQDIVQADTGQAGTRQVGTGRAGNAQKGNGA